MTKTFLRGFVALTMVAIASLIGWNWTNAEGEKVKDKRAAYGEFLASHPYNEKVNFDEWEKMPKNDRPDLAFRQNFLMTMNPELGYPTPEKLLEARPRIEAAQELFRQKNAGILDTNLPTLVWEERGPFDVGGRTRAIMFDPNDTTHKKVWAGGVSGGLWVNSDVTDPNSVWTPVGDTWQTLAVNCMDDDPTNPQVFYVGTGESVASSSYVRGQGIWKTTDGGTTWTQLSSSIIFDNVQDIVVRNENGNGVVYAAVRDLAYEGFEPTAGSHEGVYRSTDGGQTFTQVMDTVPNTQFHWAVSDLEIGPDNRIWAGTMNAIGSTQANSKGGGDILYSDDGLNWTRVNNTNGERVELAVAPSNAAYVYALIERNGLVDRIVRTTDSGNTWVSINEPDDDDPGIPSTDFSRGQAWYDLIAQVDPNDENTVVVGAINIFKSNDTGNTWQQVSHWYGGFGYPYVHADQHQFLFFPGSSSEVLSGNDGGLAYSADFNTSTPSWEDRNAGYNTTQFYAGAISPIAGSNDMLAGSQDNGTQAFFAAGLSPTNRATGGDGAFCWIDDFSPNIWITSYVYNRYWRSFNSGGSFGNFFINNNDGKFINPGDYDANLSILYTAKSSYQIYRYKNVNTTVVEEVVRLTGLRAMPSHLRVSPHIDQEATLWVGSGAGVLLQIDSADTDGSEVITDITGPNFLGNISCVEVGRDEDELITTLSNYGVTSVFYTSDGGQTWEDKEGDLPDMPVRWALFNPRDYNNVILATDLGIWETRNFMDSLPNWSPANNGMPNVRVDMLQLRESDYTIMAATHGRGVFTAQFKGGIGLEEQATADVKSQPSLYPNPVKDEFSIEFDGEGIWEMQVFNLQGALVYRDRWSEKNADRKYHLPKLESGVYLLNLRQGSEERRLKMQIR